MAASEVTVNAYILYAFMGVIVLLLIAMLGAVFRMLYVMGGLKADIAALWRAIGEMRQDIADLREQVTRLREDLSRLQEQVARLREDLSRLQVDVSRLQEQVSQLWQEFPQLREQNAENRGLLLDLHRRMDMIMRHRHEADTGNVVITPAAPEREPVAD